ncbi:MAG TPA: TlpA disulfide reductase family protein [Pyrinomonadaceae bacterium]|nr:TlpA disulfide reductase family protein [Pyrinomonadaceae bacterium]
MKNTQFPLSVTHTLLSVLVCLLIAPSSFAGGGEFTGQFETALVVNAEETERITFTPAPKERAKDAGTFDEDTQFTTAQLLDPLTGQASLLALLVEEADEDPVLFVDRDDDNRISAGERVELKNPENPYLWEATVMLPAKGGFFTTCPIRVQYFQRVKTEKMTDDERLVVQTTEVLARGMVDVNGRKVAVQYALVEKKKVNAREGWLGMDTDGDGKVDMDNLSPEAAKADNEAVVFRVGNTYLSTKKADAEKNQIILREHDAKEYKRLELYFGKEFPDFTFSDFEGKKRKLSEFRGKYVLLDIWGFWCPPCRKELPYIKEAHKRFANRNLEVIGLNTDADYTVDSMKKALKDNGMIWTQAKFESVVDFLRGGLRVSSFPTTFLISPEGKILSMSRQERKEPDLRGADLLESLDEILPTNKTAAQ